MWLALSMKRMKGHVALFPGWLWDITSKSVDKSESGLFDSDCRRFFRRSVSENLVPFSHEKFSPCPSLSPTFVASFWRVLCTIIWLIELNNIRVKHVMNLKVTIDNSKVDIRLSTSIGGHCEFFLSLAGLKKQWVYSFQAKIQWGVWPELINHRKSR